MIRPNVKVYVAGPFTKPDPLTNAREIIKVCDRLRGYGLLPYCPHLYAFWDFLLPHDYEWWMSVTIAWQDNCDCTLRVPGPSAGADREVARALERKQPVFYRIEELLEYYSRPRVYLICPVRFVTEEETQELNAYVARLEGEGYVVHYPPRDVDQRNDDGGIRIVQEHLAAMAQADEVHVWWNDKSYGSHFDLGLAVMLRYISGRNVKFVSANGVQPIAAKSFQNVLWSLCDDQSQRGTGDGTRRSISEIP